ncbi:MAG: hypothetical protein QNJ97_14580 [Myxococcota bacterium]|nr:hypothetical protein [Myxococcota bacterium]
MPRDYDNDRPKRSWREIDKNKDRSAHRKENGPSPAPHKKARMDSASKVYKSKLDAFFSGEGRAPDSVKEKLSELDANIPQADKARMSALKSIKTAGTSSAADRAVAAYLKKWDLPPDFDVLSQVLTCSEETYVEQAMDLLGEMFAGKRIPRRVQVLEQRLRRVKTLIDDPDLAKKADALIRDLRLFS